MRIPESRNSVSDPEDATQERMDEAQDSVETRANRDVSESELIIKMISKRGLNHR